MPWDYEALMINPNTTLELIDKLPDKPWQYDMMSLIPSLRIQDVVARFDPSWWVGLTKHIKGEHILQHPELRWDWHSISRSRFLDMSFVAAHPEFPWDWDEINGRQDLTMQFIQNHPDLPWMECWLSMNPCLPKAHRDNLKNIFRVDVDC